MYSVLHCLPRIKRALNSGEPLYGTLPAPRTCKMPWISIMVFCTVSWVRLYRAEKLCWEVNWQNPQQNPLHLLTYTSAATTRQKLEYQRCKQVKHVRALVFIQRNDMCAQERKNAWSALSSRAHILPLQLNGRPFMSEIMPSNRKQSE